MSSIREQPSAAGLSLRDRLLADADVDAERMVSIVRTIIALSLIAVLAFSLMTLPGPFEPEVRTQIAVAFVILGAYLLVGLVSLVLAHPARLRPWMPWLFTTADGGLILFNIAYNATSLNVSLAVAAAFPVVWLAPLTLSLTTLRYRPGLQTYSGLLLILGMIGLGLSGWLPANDNPPPDETFATTPNAMRLAMFAGCAVILVIAAQRRRALLTRAVDETARRAEYQRYLPPAIAELVAAGEIDRLRRGWRADAAVLFVDIRAFTGLSERLDPETLSRFVTAFRSRLSAVVAAHDGMVDKFVGDGAVVLFGVPEPSPTAAQRGLDCARALVAQLDSVEGQPVRLAMGAHWGEVFVGAVGDEARLEFTALGDAVNVAARLEAMSKELDRPLVVSRALLDAVGRPSPDGSDAAWLPLPTRTVRGRDGELGLLALEPGAAKP